MDVLILNLSFYPKIGGVENSLRSLCEIYSERGDQVTVVTADVVDFTGVRYPEDDFMFGARIIRFKKSHPLTYFYSCYKKLKFLKRNLVFDLVISRSHITTFLAHYAGYKRINYIVPGVVKNQYSSRFSSAKGLKAYVKLKFNEFIQMKSFSLSSVNFVFSDTMLDQVRSICPRSNIVKTIPGCDGKRFFSSCADKFRLRLDFGFNKDVKLLLCLGRLNKVKGFEFAICSLKKLPDEYHLVIVGEGPEYSNLLKYAQSLEVQDRVYFVEKTLEPEVFFRMADAFLFTSLYEPFGQVLLEATFSELKIFCFDPDKDHSVDTASRQIYSGFSSLIYFVEDKCQLGDEINSNFNSLCLEVDELKSFKDKYSWKTMVSAIDENMVQMRGMPKSSV